MNNLINEAADYVRSHIRDCKSRGLKINYGRLLYVVSRDFDVIIPELRRKLGWNKKPKQMRLKLR